MKEHKINQHIYHHLSCIEDYLDNLNYIETDIHDPELYYDICNYFCNADVNVLKFPAKSFAVAVIYSKLLEKYFNENFMISLSDTDLFSGNDKFFTPYGQNDRVCQIYDDVILFISANNLWDFESSTIINVLKTVEFFKKEFLLMK